MLDRIKEIKNVEEKPNKAEKILGALSIDYEKLSSEYYFIKELHCGNPNVLSKLLEFLNTPYAKVVKVISFGFENEFSESMKNTFQEVIEECTDRKIKGYVKTLKVTGDQVFYSLVQYCESLSLQISKIEVTDPSLWEEALPDVGFTKEFLKTAIFEQDDYYLSLNMNELMKNTSLSYLKITTNSRKNTNWCEEHVGCKNEVDHHGDPLQLLSYINIPGTFVLDKTPKGSFRKSIDIQKFDNGYCSVYSAITKKTKNYYAKTLEVSSLFKIEHEEMDFLTNFLYLKAELEPIYHNRSVFPTIHEKLLSVDASEIETLITEYFSNRWSDGKIPSFSYLAIRKLPQS